MNTIIPDFDLSTKITDKNESFKFKVDNIGEDKIYQFTYHLASANDFFDTFKDQSNVVSTELRGLSFVLSKEKYKRYLFVSKFFNINETNGSAKPLTITLNENYSFNNNELFFILEDTVMRGTDLKVGMKNVFKYDRQNNETYGKPLKIDKIELSEVDYNIDNSWMLHDIKNLTVTRLADKEDGSAIRFIKVNGDIISKTKFSLDNEQTDMANNLLKNNPDLYSFVKETLDNGLAAIFELVSPFNKVVLKYPITELKLLQLRDENTGEYLDIYNNVLVAKYAVKKAFSYNIERINKILPFISEDFVVNISKVRTIVSLEDLISDIENTHSNNILEEEMSILDFLLIARTFIEDKEGWIVHFNNGKIAKIKTIWYLEKHHLVTDGLKEHLIIAKVLDETIDDLMSILPENDIEERKFISDIENKIVILLNSKSKELVHIVDTEYKDNNRLDIVKKYEKTKFFGIIMKLLNNNNLEKSEEMVKNYILKNTNKLNKAINFLEEL